MTIVSLALVLSSLVGVLPADPSSFDAVDAYVEEHRKEHDVPGVAYAVVQHGEVVLQGATGTDGDGSPVTPETPFLVGSVAKTFTALTVMQLAEAGELDLDEPVQRSLPWFQLADDDASARITPRHLLTHTSGISESAGLQVADRFDNEADAIERAVRDLQDVTPIDDPGASYEYSSANYLVLGAVVESVSGTTFEEHLTGSVLEPLRMQHAAVSDADPLPPGHRLAFGRAWEFDPGYDASGLPYGYLGASLDDLTHLVEAELDEGRYAGARALDPTAVRLTQEPREQVEEDAYRYGWRESEVDGLRTLWHSGATPGYFATVLLVPDEELGVVVLQNAYSPSRDAQLNEAAANVLRILRDEPPREVGADPVLALAPWVLVATAAAVLSGAGASALRARRRGVARRRSLAWVGGSACLGVLAALLPRALGADWARARLWTPDVAIGIGTLVVACALAVACHGVLVARATLQERRSTG